MSTDATGRDVETETCTSPTSIIGDGSIKISTSTGTALPSSSPAPPELEPSPWLALPPAVLPPGSVSGALGSGGASLVVSFVELLEVLRSGGASSERPYHAGAWKEHAASTRMAHKISSTWRISMASASLARNNKPVYPVARVAMA
ncbi:hypothetical protein [Nannocystis punicea]|uniref:Uncharacterized protein n=1 Tax=Nannocystis punicea TaxID=2995304 RepID=A0ABY7GU35_9BACT|nr:hypothetical protein [Nannocystis poenicansa]WAS90467.1 hypothetical protein O0S08_30120 [Nannocystis poenicansa]